MKSIHKYFYIFKISIANNLIYVGNFIARNIFLVFIVYVMLLLWKVIYGEQEGSVAGFTLNQMIWYLIVTEIVTLSKSNIFREVSEDVKKGNIAYLLNKPYHYVIYCFANSLGEILTRLVGNLVVALAIGLLYVGPLQPFSLKHLPFILLSILFGIFLNFFIYINLALTAFWLEDNTAITWIYSKLVFTLGGMLIPLELFPNWLASVARYLPFAYVTYGPARLAVNFNLIDFIHTISYQLGFLFIFILISAVVFRRGVRVLNVNGG